jgi:hypothetical protein
MDSAAIRRGMTRWQVVRGQSNVGDYGNRTKRTDSVLPDNISFFSNMLGPRSTGLGMTEMDSPLRQGPAGNCCVTLCIYVLVRVCRQPWTARSHVYKTTRPLSLIGSAWAWDRTTALCVLVGTKHLSCHGDFWEHYGAVQVGDGSCGCLAW